MRREWAAWDTYTATWSSASNPQPSLVNGALRAAFRRNGTTGYLRGSLTMGSSTTKGTGEWRISLPTDWVASANLTNGWQTGRATCFGASTYPAECYIAPSGTVLGFVHASPWAAVTATVPFTWGTNHFLSWQIVLELAS